MAQRDYDAYSTSRRGYGDAQPAAGGGGLLASTRKVGRTVATFFMGGPGDYQHVYRRAGDPEPESFVSRIRSYSRNRLSRSGDTPMSALASNAPYDAPPAFGRGKTGGNGYSPSDYTRDTSQRTANPRPSFETPKSTDPRGMGAEFSAPRKTSAADINTWSDDSWKRQQENDDLLAFVNGDAAKVLAEIDEENKEPAPQYFPRFILLVSFVNVLMLAIEIALNRGFAPYEANPMFGPAQPVLVEMGAKYGPLILQGQWWRFLTPVFMHVGVLHLAFNLITQLRVALSLERAFGWMRVAPIYLISGIGGNMFSALLLPYQVQVGASGALFGMLGTCVIDLIKCWKVTPNPKRQAFVLGFQMVFSFIVGLLPFVDNFAHIGGFITGLLLSIIFVPSLQFGQWSVRNRLISICAALIGLVIWFAVGFSTFYKNADGAPVCEFCKYFYCQIACDQAVQGGQYPPPPPPPPPK